MADFASPLGSMRPFEAGDGGDFPFTTSSRMAGTGGGSVAFSSPFSIIRHYAGGCSGGVAVASATASSPADASVATLPAVISANIAPIVGDSGGTFSIPIMGNTAVGGGGSASAVGSDYLTALKSDGHHRRQGSSSSIASLRIAGSIHRSVSAMRMAEEHLLMPAGSLVVARRCADGGVAAASVGFPSDSLPCTSEGDSAVAPGLAAAAAAGRGSRVGDGASALPLAVGGWPPKGLCSTRGHDDQQEGGDGDDGGADDAFFDSIRRGTCGAVPVGDRAHGCDLYCIPTAPVETAGQSSAALGLAVRKNPPEGEQGGNDEARPAADQRVGIVAALKNRRRAAVAPSPQSSRVLGPRKARAPTTRQGKQGAPSSMTLKRR